MVKYLYRYSILEFTDGTFVTVMYKKQKPKSFWESLFKNFPVEHEELYRGDDPALAKAAKDGHVRERKPPVIKNRHRYTSTGDIESSY